MSAKVNKQKLVMISFDAVSSDNLSLLCNMPNFGSLRKRGTLVRNVSSVVVSNTYPAHTSIITGVHPGKHRIVENLHCTPGEKCEAWRYHASDIKAPTLYDRVREQGGNVCSILYPVTGGAKIRYNFPEIAGSMPLFKRVWKILSLGSPSFILSCFWRLHSHFKGMNEPELDDFSTAIACDVWQRHRPDLLMLHLIDADSHKHDYGPESEQAIHAIERLDQRLGKLLRVLESNTEEPVALIILSDHGCRAVHTAIEPNDFLSERGFAQDGWFHNAGGTTFLHIKGHPATGDHQAEKAQRDTADKTDADTLIAGFLKQPYVSRQLSAEEMRISGMGEHFLAGFEAVAGYSFGKRHLGQHGYALQRAGDLPFYLAVGENISQGEELSGGCIVDICPLAADILNIPKWEMDGVNRLK